MSHTFSIACTQCKQHLWIAQGWPRPELGQPTKDCRIYRGEKHDAAQLKFFFDHRGHPLVFDENCDGDIGYYDELNTETLKYEPTGDYYPS